MSLSLTSLVIRWIYLSLPPRVIRMIKERTPGIFPSLGLASGQPGSEQMLTDCEFSPCLSPIAMFTKWFSHHGSQRSYDTTAPCHGEMSLLKPEVPKPPDYSLYHVPAATWTRPSRVPQWEGKWQWCMLTLERSMVMEGKGMVMVMEGKWQWCILMLGGAWSWRQGCLHWNPESQWGTPASPCIVLNMVSTSKIVTVFEHGAASRLALHQYELPLS